MRCPSQKRNSKICSPICCAHRGPWSWHHPSMKKNHNLFGNNGLFMGSRMAQEIIFGLFPFSRNMILQLGGGGSCITWSQRWLVSRSTQGDLFGIRFMGSSDIQPMTTPKLALKSYQPFKQSKNSIFFKKEIAL